MKPTRMPGALGAVIALALGGALRADPRSIPPAPEPEPVAGESDDLAAEVTQGALRATAGGRVVECPLRHTEVQADVSGFLARVRVAQTFENPYDEQIEAVYVFPLPHTAAVDDMTMVIGERRVVGVIRRRAEARAVYEEAVTRGYTASLLEQERPNIFTQSVGNIRAGQEVRIEISYVDVLPYDRGVYEFHFPMVVGPRYIPGAPLGGASTGGGWSLDTRRVPDASRITPPVLKPDERSGHDIAVRLRVEAGVPIHGVEVKSHRAVVDRPARSRATAVLSAADSIPNKDFVVTYRVVGAQLETAVLAHAVPGADGYFLLMMQPRDMEDALREAPPRDVCFLIDVSGSMSGAPTAKVIDAMRQFFERAKPEDRLQVVTFAGAAQRLFETYVPATPDNLGRAMRFTDGLQGSGGTEMLKGIQMVLADPVEPQRVRVIVMLTDGYIGNEAEIIREVGRRAGDQLRFWTVGIGASPNRFLLDGVARQGGGMSAVLDLKDDPSELVGRIVERIHRAQLSRIELDWGGLEVSETYPARVPELWAGRPVVVLGRHRGAGPTTVRISGLAEGVPAVFPLQVTFPEQDVGHGVLAKAWARRKIEDLSDQLVVARGDPEPLVEDITELALEYRLMSAYTSFVAVDEAEGPAMEGPRPPRRVMVPVPLPDGVSYEGVFGDEESDQGMAAEMVVAHAAPARGRARRAREVKRGAPTVVLYSPQATAVVGSAPGRVGGAHGGVVGGAAGGVASSLPPGPTFAVPAASYEMMVMDAAQMRRDGNQGYGTDPLERSATHQAEARGALARARTLAEKKDWNGALRHVQLAWVLEVAHLRAQPWADDGTQAAIAELGARVRQALDDAAAAAAPALRKRLDLVIRNTGLEEALRMVAGAAGLSLRVETGSLADAAAIVGEPLRVPWLDLRRATTAQALTWLLQPVGLEWALDGGAVVVRSARRAPGAAPWTYDVTDLAEPRPDKDTAVPVEAVRTAAREIEQAAQAAGGSRTRVTMLGPERLLVMDGPEVHARVAILLDGLRRGTATGPSRELASRTAARAAAWSETIRKRSRLRALRLVAATLHESSWTLLAAALHGTVDEEAVARLMEAVQSTSFAGLDREAPTLLLRTLYVIAQARTAAPDDAALQAVSLAAFERAAPALKRLSVRLASSGQDEALTLASVYLTLLQRIPARFVPAGTVPTTPAKAHGVGGALVAGDAATAAKAMAAGQLRTDDGAVLAGLVLRRAGTAHWNAFRDQRAERIGQWGLSAGAARVLSRLDGTPAPRLTTR